MADTALLLALVAAQQRAQTRLTDRTMTQISRMVAAMSGSWYDHAAVDTAAAEMAALVRAGQTLSAGVTQAYLDQVLTTLDTPVPKGAVVLPAGNLRGVDALVQWARPAKVFRRAITQGNDPAAATSLAQLRAAQMAQDDLTLSMRVAAQQRLQAAPKVTGFRRVVHFSTGTCGLCIAAADRVYHKAGLLPIHNRCRCSVMPVIAGKADPAAAMNGDLYQRVRAAAGSTSAADLAKTRLVVDEHGELGPILRDGRHSYRTHDDAVADLNDPSDAVPTS